MQRMTIVRLVMFGAVAVMGALAVLVAILVGALDVAGEQKAPSDIAWAYVRGLQAGDVPAVEAVFCGVSGPLASLMDGGNMRFEDVQVTEQARDNAVATVHVSGVWLRDQDAGAERGAFDWTLRMARVEGDWCVREVVNLAALAQ